LATANFSPYQYNAEFIEFIAEVMVKDKDVLDQYNAQDLSNTAWAVTKIVNLSELKVKSVLDTRIQQSALSIIHLVGKDVIHRKASGFNAQQLSNTALAFAKIGSNDTKLIQDAMQIIIEKALQGIPQFSSQSASNLVWAVAQVFESKTYSIQHLLHSIGNQLADTGFVAQPQHVSITLHSFAKLKFDDATLYRRIASRLQSNNAFLFTGQSVANIVWALATAGVKIQDNKMQNTTLPLQPLQNSKNIHHSYVIDPVLQGCAVAVQEFIKRPQEFNSQDISNLCWGFAELGVKDSQFVMKVEQEIKFRINNFHSDMSIFNGQEIANILWQVH
jgi:hypothetical protein